MTQPADDEILATLRATAFRRWIGIVLLCGFALMLGKAALELPADRLAIKLAIFALGLVSLVQAVLLWRATARGIELTADLLRETGPQGRVLARLADIARVDTGAFSYRPASGFLIHLNAPAGFAMVPGMWWRRGRRIGIGGVTSKAHGKIFAAEINRRLAEMRR